jgi:hypothetical protein
MKKRRSIQLICECEHACHFEMDPANLPEGIDGSNHKYGAKATYVTRGTGGLLYCQGCTKVGHGLMGFRRKDAFQRFNEGALAAKTVKTFNQRPLFHGAACACVVCERITCDRHCSGRWRLLAASPSLPVSVVPSRLPGPSPRTLSAMRDDRARLQRTPHPHSSEEPMKTVSIITQQDLTARRRVSDLANEARSGQARRGSRSPRMPPSLRSLRLRLFKQMARRGLNPTHMIDVGAHKVSAPENTLQSGLGIEREWPKLS